MDIILIAVIFSALIGYWAERVLLRLRKNK